MGEVDARVVGHRDSAQDALFGAAVASVVFGALEKFGGGPGQCLLSGGE
ncbi:MAG: hypothetical protein ACRDTS_20430 [Mycobacterium sp.]